MRKVCKLSYMDMCMELTGMHCLHIAEEQHRLNSESQSKLGQQTGRAQEPAVSAASLNKDTRDHV